VEVTDATGSVHVAQTNCAGNFYVTTTDWDPVFPLTVQVTHSAIDKPGHAWPMLSKIGRDGSCAGCHVSASGPASPGRVYITDESAADWPWPAQDCGRRD